MRHLSDAEKIDLARLLPLGSACTTLVLGPGCGDSPSTDVTESLVSRGLAVYEKCANRDHPRGRHKHPRITTMGRLILSVVP
jgi:hypothetical protein